MKPHLELAHHYFERIVRPEDTVIDATCGNGHDTLKLTSLAYLGKIYAIDIQEDAINKTKERLQSVDNVHLIQSCHSQFPKEILPKSVALIVYNLGYLPGSDKSLITTLKTTQESLIHAMELVMLSGWISIMCYPGHKEGLKEESALLEFCQELNPRKWSVCHHRFVNRRLSPSLLMIQCLRG